MFLTSFSSGFQFINDIANSNRSKWNLDTGNRENERNENWIGK